MTFYVLIFRTKVKMAEAKPDIVNSPIIMKVDSPTEDKLENEDNEKSEISLRPSQICSPSVRTSKPLLAASRLGNPFGATNIAPVIFKLNDVLRAPVLGNLSAAAATMNSTKSPFTLNPSKLNPFAKATQKSADSSVNSADSSGKVKSSANGETPKFVPLLHTENNISESSNSVKTINSSGTAPPTPSNSFVFGQNLQERISGDAEPKPSTSCVSSSNGTSSTDNMLFSTAIKESPSSDVSSTTSKSLSESAKEYEEQRANKRKYEEVEVKTGEEGEINIVQISCKLFSFDKGSWQERGRGILRLNDREIRDEDGNYYDQSRLVFRTSGSLRVILNTKIWSEMDIQIAGVKSIRLTAMDSNGDIKLFLVMSTPEDVKQLCKLLNDRVSNDQKRQRHKRSTTNTETVETPVATTTISSDIVSSDSGQ